MAKYNFFISYCRKDGFEIAKTVTDLLIEKGYTVWIDDYALRAGDDYADSIKEAIINCDCFLPIITEQYNYSKWTYRELAFALDMSSKRAQKVIPLLFTDVIEAVIKFYISSLHCIKIKNPDGVSGAVEQIDSIYGYKIKSAVLYEKLSELKRIKNGNKTATTICELIELICSKWENAQDSLLKEKQNLCNELCRLYRELENYVGCYDKESRDVAHIIINALDRVEKMLNAATDHPSGENIFHRHIYFSSIAIRLLYSDRIIRQECADVLTSGDVHNSCPVEWYIERQKSFVTAYARLLINIDDIQISADDVSFITNTQKFIFENIDTKSFFESKTRNEVRLSETDDILLSVAKFMQEGNKLFDALQAKGMAGDFLNCLLTSYERLKNYCEVVGATKVAADCIDRIVEIRNAIERADDNASSDKKVENGIKSLLGFTLRGSGNYDVFISFKSEDSDLAERVYNFCQKNLKVPFWSKRTLPQLSKSEYEDAIYDAIRKSKHFVVVLSNLEYLKANWIKKEMSSFDRAMTEGRKVDANFVFVVTDDVYQQIIDSNKMCLDERYCGYQIIKMSEYEKTLMSYIV